MRNCCYTRNVEAIGLFKHLLYFSNLVRNRQISVMPLGKYYRTRIMYAPIDFIGSGFGVREKGDFVAFHCERFVHLSISDTDETPPPFPPKKFCLGR